jgi:hypothetical protein
MLQESGEIQNYQKAIIRTAYDFCHSALPNPSEETGFVKGMQAVQSMPNMPKPEVHRFAR